MSCCVYSINVVVILRLLFYTSVKVRLVDGDASSGRVEILYDGDWGTVCDDGWDLDDGIVVCRQLGFRDAIAVYTNSHFGGGSGNILLDEVNCTGSESRISDCSHDGWGVEDCIDEFEAAGVECGG